MSDDEKPTGAVAWELNAKRNGFVAPLPAHHLSTPAAAARDALRDFAAANPVQIVDGKTKRVPVTPPELDIVGPLPRWRWADLKELTGSALSFALDARGGYRRPARIVKKVKVPAVDVPLTGFAITALVAGDAVEVRIDRGRIRAWWKAGRTTGVVMNGKKVTLTEAKAAL